jgi:hypothetical protein
MRTCVVRLLIVGDSPYVSCAAFISAWTDAFFIVLVVKTTKKKEQISLTGIANNRTVTK